MKPLLLFFTALIASIPLSAKAFELPLFPDLLDSKGVWSLAWENDIFAGEDDNYTNGIRISWFSSEKEVPRWLTRLSDQVPGFMEDGQERYGFSLGQSMFTPRDIATRTPDPNDRPYAGWLYGSVHLISTSEKARTGSLWNSRMDQLQLQLGVVGPASGVAEAQDAVHHWIGSPDPRGWHTQLKNEPGIVLSYERQWRKQLAAVTPFGMAVDVSPLVGADLGNVYTQGKLGGLIRVGYDLPSDYGPPRIKPGLQGSDFFEPHDTFGWYLFAGVEGRAVARNIFLDGNTFRDSSGVDKKHLVGDIQVGAAVTWESVRFAYTHIFRTKEFDTQPQADSFGAFTMSYRF